MASSRNRRKSKLDLDLMPRRFPAFLSKYVRDDLARIAGSDALAQRWEPGRQGTGYEKVDLRAALADGALEPERAFVDGQLTAARVSFGIDDIRGWDAYLLRYQDGAHVPEHTDPTTGEIHTRLNAIVRAGERGSGQLRLRGAVFDLEAGDAVLFRPDAVSHRVSPVIGERIVLSIGCVSVPAE